MKTATLEMTKRLIALGYDGFGIVQAIDNTTGEGCLQLRPMSFEAVTPAPLLEHVKEWLREKKIVLVDVYPFTTAEDARTVKWKYEIGVNLTGHRNYRIRPEYNTYDEALEAGISEAMTWVKDNQSDNQ